MLEIHISVVTIYEYDTDNLTPYSAELISAAAYYLVCVPKPLSSTTVPYTMVYVTPPPGLIFHARYLHSWDSISSVGAKKAGVGRCR